MNREYRKLIGDFWQITLPDERWYSKHSEREMDEKKTIDRVEDFMPSSTWICSYYPKDAAFLKWYAERGIDKAEEIKNAAGEKGSRVHHACDELMLGHEVKMDDKFIDSNGEAKELTADEYWTIMTFKKFLDDEQPVILGVEYTVRNFEHNYAGTVDIKCRLKSDGYKFVHIVDIKTSKSIYPSHELQVSSYKQADPECDKIDIVQVGYKLNKNGYKLTEIEPNFDLFLNIKGVWKNENDKVLVPQLLYPVSLLWTPVKLQDIQSQIKVAN